MSDLSSSRAGAGTGAILGTVRMAALAALSAEMRTLLSRTSLVVAARVGGSLLTLFYTVLLARLTSAQEFGVAMTALSAAMLISVFVSLNVESGSIRYLVAYLERGERAAAAGFVAFSWRLVLLVSPVLLVPLYLSVPHLLAALGSTGTTDLVVAMTLAAAPLIALTRVCGRHATALDAVLKGVLPRLLVRPALFALVLAGLVLAGAQVSAGAVMAIFLCAALLTAVLQVVLLRPELGFAVHERREAHSWRDWVATGLMLTPMLVMGEFLKPLITASAALAMPAEAVAQLAIALALLALLNFALAAVDMTFSPRLARALVGGRAVRANRLLLALGALKCAGLAAGALALSVLSEPILSLFGAHYLGAAQTVLILLALPAAGALFGPAAVVLNICGHRRELLLGCSVGAVATVAATALGGALGGVEGAAAGAAGASVLQHGLLYALMRARTGIDTSPLMLLGRDLGLRR